MAKYDGLLGQPLLEIEDPDKEGGVTFIMKDNRFLFIKVVDGIHNAVVELSPRKAEDAGDQRGLRKDNVLFSTGG